MENLIVKFGTQKPIGFREYDKDHPQIDLDLEVNAAGQSEVSDYDGGLYGGEKEVVSKTREIALKSLTECISSWPEGKSFWKSMTKTVLEKHIDERLAEHGITAETGLYSLVLTSESRELYDAAVKDMTEQQWFIDRIAPYKNVIDGNEGQPKIDTSNYVRPPMGKNPFTPSSNDEGFRTDENTVFGIVPRGSPIRTSGDKYCRNCGAKRENDAKFCLKCGSKFS